MKRLITRTTMVAGIAATLFATLVLGQDSPTLRVKILLNSKRQERHSRQVAILSRKAPLLV